MRGLIATSIAQFRAEGNQKAACIFVKKGDTEYIDTIAECPLFKDIPVEKIEDLKELTISLLYRDDDWNETSFSVILPVESQGQAVL